MLFKFKSLQGIFIICGGENNGTFNCDLIKYFETTSHPKVEYLRKINSGCSLFKNHSIDSSTECNIVETSTFSSSNKSI